GFSFPARAPGDDRAALRDQFGVIARSQRCVFCDLPLRPRGGADANSSLCDNGHVFGAFYILHPTPYTPFLLPTLENKSLSRMTDGLVENCANTGVPVTAPNVSRTCGVCGMKCLKPEELLHVAPQLADIVREDISAVFCGGCGGKFTN
ncbi:hypothetical protein EKO27_g7255, partial [Xylaria grammica]